MRPFHALVLAGILALVAFVPSAAATAPPCMTSAPTGDVEPTGPTPSNDLVVRAKFTLTSLGGCSTTGVYCSVIIQGVTYWGCDYETWDVVWATAQPTLPPGTYRAIATVTVDTGAPQYWSPHSSSIIWSFSVMQEVLGGSNSVSVPSVIPVAIPEVCPIVACVGPANLGIPVPATAGVGYDDLSIARGGDPHLGTYGPDPQTISTPFGDVPLVLCPQTCPFLIVDPALWVHGSVRVHAEAGTQTLVDETQEIHWSYP